MKKLQHTLPILLTGLLLQVANLQCKKFEEDTELIHFRTKKKRIEGVKELTMHRLGPTDLLPYWHSRFGDFYLYLSKISVDKKSQTENYGYGYKVYVYTKQTDSLICNGSWGFGGHDRIFIHFDCLNSDTSSSFPNNIHGISGTIVRLSNKEMRFKNEGAWHSGLQMIVESTEARFVEYKKN